MKRSVELRLKLNQPQTNWILTSIFEALEDDEEITLFETTHTDEYITVYIQFRCYHQPDWVITLIRDQLQPGEQLLDFKLK